MRGDGANSDVREVAGVQELEELQSKIGLVPLGSDFLKSGSEVKARPYFGVGKPSPAYFEKLQEFRSCRSYRIKSDLCPGLNGAKIRRI
jgi:hypothetical protein